MVTTAIAAAFAAVVLLTLAWLLVVRRERSAVALLIAGGFCLHLFERWDYPTTLSAIVRSDMCNSFFSVARTYRPTELLTQFGALVPTLPLHAMTNMPGKSVIFHVLGLISGDPETLGVLIIAWSDLTGIVVYLIARRWFSSRHVAVLATALYLAFPARSVFFPVLNVVSPFFILLALYSWLLFFDSRRSRWLWVTGVCLYAAVFTDPITLAIGIVFLGVLTQRISRDSLGLETVARALLLPVAGFVGVHLAMQLGLGFNIVSAFGMLANTLISFNVIAGRPYGVWVVKDLTEFVISSGFLTSVIVIAGSWTSATAVIEAPSHDRQRLLREAVSLPGPNLLLFLTLNIIVLDLMGMNRGEVTRLWIFLSIPVQMAAAWLCIERYGTLSAALVVAAATFQSGLMLGTVGFLVC